MRRVPTESFARLSSPESLWRAFLRCREGKRRGRTMATFDLYADQHVLALHRELTEQRYRPRPHGLRVIRDPKVRLIAAAPVRDRVVHQALVSELAPAYEPSFIDHSYACCQGRGAHRALLRYLLLSRRRGFRLSLDIQRYFASVRHEVLLGLFARRLRDPRTLALLEALIRGGGQVYQSPQALAVLGPVPLGCGMPIGSLLSQWSGSYYLDGLDHFIKRDLKISGYLRYMDDFTLFDDDRLRLVDARAGIAAWLWAERGLTLNPKRLEVRPAAEPSVFLGFRVSRAGLYPGPKIRKRLRVRVAAAAEAGPEALARCLASYRGIYLL